MPRLLGADIPRILFPLFLIVLFLVFFSLIFVWQRKRWEMIVFERSKFENSKHEEAKCIWNMRNEAKRNRKTKPEKRNKRNSRFKKKGKIEKKKIQNKTWRIKKYEVSDNKKNEKIIKSWKVMDRKKPAAISRLNRKPVTRKRRWKQRQWREPDEKSCKPTTNNFGRYFFIRFSYLFGR